MRSFLFQHDNKAHFTESGYKPNLIYQHQCLTSLDIDYLMCGKPSRGTKAVLAAMAALIPFVSKLYLLAHLGVVFRCPHALGHFNEVFKIVSVTEKTT